MAKLHTQEACNPSEHTEFFSENAIDEHFGAQKRRRWFFFFIFFNKKREKNGDTAMQLIFEHAPWF